MVDLVSVSVLFLQPAGVLVKESLVMTLEPHKRGKFSLSKSNHVKFLKFEARLPEVNQIYIYPHTHTHNLGGTERKILNSGISEKDMAPSTPRSTEISVTG